MVLKIETFKIGIMLIPNDRKDMLVRIQLTLQNLIFLRKKECF